MIWRWRGRAFVLSRTFTPSYLIDGINDSFGSLPLSTSFDDGSGMTWLSVLRTTFYHVHDIGGAERQFSVFTPF